MKQKTHILLFYEQSIPTSQGLSAMMTSFEKKYSIEILSKRSNRVTPNDIVWSDVVVCIRGQSCLEATIMRRAKQAKRFCITFWDDDLLDPDTEYVMLTHRKVFLRRILCKSDLIWSSNILLGNKLAKYTKEKRIAISDTAVNPQDIATRKKNKTDEKVKIVYAAGREHAAFFDRYILPCMPQLSSEYREKISIWFVGVHPDLRSLNDAIEIHYVEGMPLQQYREYMRNSDFDIGLAPLTEGGMRKYKYFNKFIEYSMMGIMGIYSDCSPYSLVVQDGITGALCSNEPCEWFHTIGEAIDDISRREQCVANAQRLLREEFSEEKIFAKLTCDIPELLMYRAIVCECKGWLVTRLCYRLYRIYELPVLGLMYLAKHGILRTYHAIVQRRKALKVNK